VISPKRSIGTLTVPLAVPNCFSWTSMERVCPPKVDRVRLGVGVPGVPRLRRHRREEAAPRLAHARGGDVDVAIGFREAAALGRREPDDVVERERRGGVGGGGASAPSSSTARAARSAPFPRRGAPRSIHRCPRDA
jgi:hypothetical protein